MGMDEDMEKKAPETEAAAIDSNEDMEARLTLKPLSSNAFAAFWQKLYRSWMGVWEGFKMKHPTGAAWIYKIVFFLVFSIGVTIWQYLVILFLPYAFTSLNNGSWGWAPFQILGVDCAIFGDADGLGSFIAYEIAVFTAQCINFPLQRNITYHSHGNPVFQALWYFIAWVLISVFTGVLWGFANCVLTYWNAPAGVTSLVKTLITGIISLIVMFFVFIVIFPDADKTVAKRKKAYEAARAAMEADPGNAARKAACAKAELAYTKAQEIADVYHAEMTIHEKENLAQALIAGYGKARKDLGKAINSTAEQVSEGTMTQEAADAAVSKAQELVDRSRESAIQAVISRDETVPGQKEILERVQAQRAARAEAEKASKAS
ncbi:MAG: hypothetical protein LUE27_08335 [Clostridia bacterium]|nr:hypothetical protein [Clostridia bacterium]